MPFALCQAWEENGSGSYKLDGYSLHLTELARRQFIEQHTPSEDLAQSVASAFIRPFGSPRWVLATTEWLAELADSPDQSMWGKTGRIMPPWAERSSGVTTQQIAMAPLKALYICPSRDETYYKNLSRKLSRDDLETRSINCLNDGGAGLTGERRRVVIDHGCELTDSQMRGWIAHEDQVAKRMM